MLLVGVGLLWLTFRNENPAEIFSKLKSADPFWLGLSVVLAIAAFVSRAVRWIMLMEPLGYKPRLSVTMYSLMIGYFANLAIPRIGEITRCGALANSEKVPFNSLIGTVIVERVIDLLMLFISMLVVAIIEFDLLSSFLMDKIITPMSGKFLYLNNMWFYIVLLISASLLVFFIRKFRKKQNSEHRLMNRLRGLLAGVAAGFKTILRMKNNGWFIFHTIFIWVVYFFMTFVCFFCLEATSHLDVKAGMFVLVVGGLGMSAPVQGGIGAYHYIVSQGLQLFGVSATDGIVYATLVHTTQTLLVVVLGLLALLLLFMDRKKTANG